MTEQEKQEIRERVESFLVTTQDRADIKRLLDALEEQAKEISRISIDYDNLYKEAMISAGNYQQWEKELKDENQRLRKSLLKIGNYSTIFENGFSSSLNPLQEVKKMVRQALEENRQ